jgi:hypothetical protein
MGWVANATPRPLYSRERWGTHCIGGWVVPRAGLDSCVRLGLATKLTQDLVKKMLILLSGADFLQYSWR